MIFERRRPRRRSKAPKPCRQRQRNGESYAVRMIPKHSRWGVVFFFVLFFLLRVVVSKMLLIDCYYLKLDIYLYIYIYIQRLKLAYRWCLLFYFFGGYFLPISIGRWWIHFDKHVGLQRCWSTAVGGWKRRNCFLIGSLRKWTCTPTKFNIALKS